MNEPFQIKSSDPELASKIGKAVFGDREHEAGFEPGSSSELLVLKFKSQLNGQSQCLVAEAANWSAVSQEEKLVTFSERAAIEPGFFDTTVEHFKQCVERADVKPVGMKETA